jgi:hypothetical protein
MDARPPVESICSPNIAVGFTFASPQSQTRATKSTDDPKNILNEVFNDVTQNYVQSKLFSLKAKIGLVRGARSK